jgi:RimJ/RimL family protein N-acetyltransferase
MESFRSPVTLQGRWVRLVPLALGQATALRAAAQDPEIRRYLVPGPGETQAEMEALISLLLERQKVGTDLPFTIVLRADGRAVGMTRFLHVDRTNRSVEVGGTWLDSALWRTPVNTESKFLLFRHAFETEKVHRVSLRADLNDERGQRAVARLGAVREAVFRDDRLLPDGSFHSSVVYGILASEWTNVRNGLETMLAHDWNPPELSGPTAGTGGSARAPPR